MKSKARHLVYYTLYLAGNGRSHSSLLHQHIASVESLRRRNQSIPICLAVCGRKLHPKDQRHLENLRVQIRYIGSYQIELKRRGLGVLAAVLGEIPNSPKWISLPEILNLRFDRVLYIDNDTFVIRDVEELFQAAQAADVCAREEPWTKRSHLGYDSAYVNESAMRSLLRSEKLNSIVPFNTGVVLMKRQVAEWLSRNLDLFLSYLVRFTMWMAERRPSRDDEPFVTMTRELNINETSTGLSPLRYPCSNQWIVDELALWFTLAARSFKVRLFPRSLVLQANEFLDIGRRFQMPCLVHYYSGNSEYFFPWLRRFEPRLQSAVQRGK